jgi:hypothetical protein
VSYQPTVEGARAATLNAHVAGGAAAFSLPLSATTEPADLQIALPPGSTVLDFGIVVVGTLSSPLPLVVRNATPGFALTIDDVSFDDPSFSIDLTKGPLTLAYVDDTASFPMWFVPPSGGKTDSMVRIRVKEVPGVVAAAQVTGSGEIEGYWGPRGCHVAPGAPGGGSSGSGLLAIALLVVAVRRRILRVRA